MNKFIYVFGIDDRDMLLAEDFHLLKSDTKNNIYVFENKSGMKFSVDKINCVFSDTLTF